MKVKKILNNNVAIIDKGGHESIIYSSGISFKKKVGQPIIDSEIEKVYVLDSKDRLEHFSYLMSHSEERMICLVNSLVEYGEKNLGQKANDYLYLALLDHITFAWKRGTKEQFIRSPLSWEVQKFYPTYYRVALHGVEMMRKTFEIDFPDDEAVSIALHFVNIQEENSLLNEKIEDMETLRDMLNIIKYHFNISFDETSINYMRLVTHLQYFIERLHKNNSYQDGEATLFEQVKNLYPQAFKAVEKIEIYVKGKFNQYLTSDEYTYLMLHVNRVTERKREDEISKI
ncbi:PRD domain-containing protein [Lactococcus garvieae]|uniref:PRD domain-containing protein n=2 Tax=Lactococcus garvieae TaxID=1363 RepID=UPI00159643A6|nr:PRD domain-containing protein [Lactococcus garvieae]